MQTFLCEEDYSATASVLDQKRLVKQLLECRQIMTALAGESKGWVHHPATKMWRGYEAELLLYSDAIRNELQSRGYKWENNWSILYDVFRRNFNGTQAWVPEWKQDSDKYEKIINTHRANLFIKDPTHYFQYEEEVDTYRSNVCCDRCNYFWVAHV